MLGPGALRKKTQTHANNCGAQSNQLLSQLTRRGSSYLYADSRGSLSPPRPPPSLNLAPSEGVFTVQGTKVYANDIHPNTIISTASHMHSVRSPSKSSETKGNPNLTVKYAHFQPFSNFSLATTFCDQPQCMLIIEDGQVAVPLKEVLGG